MRQLVFIIVLFFTCPFLINGQTVIFKDTIFKKGDKLSAHPIRFALADAIIQQESYTYLDSLASFLLRNKSLVIEVGVHTDTRWSDKYSMCLTCKRARAVRTYLIYKEVAPDRIISKGYNDSEPLIPEEKINKLKSLEEVEKAHQTNRRTEFKILSTDYESDTIDLSNLSDVKNSMKGKWFRYWENDTIVENFRFIENTFQGECKSEEYISTAPVFKLMRQDEVTIIRWLDLTGGEFDFIILGLTSSSMIVQHEGAKIQYFKKD